MSGNLRERPEAVWRPLERSLGPAGNWYVLGGFVRWQLVMRWCPRRFIGVRYARGEWFAGCHVQDRFQKRDSAAVALRHQRNKRPWAA